MKAITKFNLIKLGFVLYIIILLRITIFRSSLSPTSFLHGKINIIPLENYFILLSKGYIFQFFYLLLGNIVWFIPFGIYMTKVKEYNTLKTVIYGLLFSFLIELIQFIFGTGLSETDDLILNTLGCCIGIFLCRRNKKIP